jgi:hypothetical protein
LDAVLRRYVERLSRDAHDAHLQLTANWIFGSVIMEDYQRLPNDQLQIKLEIQSFRRV